MVVAYSQWLARDFGPQLPETARQFLEFIETGGSRMNSLLAALRDYMQVSDSGGEEVKRTDAEDSLSLALSNLQSAIDDSGATVTSDPLPNVLAAPVPLAQVFQNLIANAIRYAKPGEPPCIHVSAAPNGAECIFSVRDNGIGIAPEYHDRIFGLFKRLQGGGKGTGIGLAICKAAVERWGGRIWVESAPGAGATFRFSAAYPKEDR